VGAQVEAQNLAYVIYTSGSTGRPKGVMITHRSAAAFIQWAAETFSKEDFAGVLASTSITFDLSIFELFATLSCGGRVIMADDALQLTSMGAAAGVTLINTVPSAMAELVRMGAVPDTVRVVNLAGEALKNQLAQGVYEQSRVERVYNLYGPSEDTTYSTYTLVERGAQNEPTIGRPITNTQVYILDKCLEPVALGVAGELYIGGSGLARGYINRPSPTAEKFIPDPFGVEVGARLYKTGDRARYLSDGSIEFLGRLDNQVKVRGYRIELGEVEAALLRHGGVAEAAVLVRGEGASAAIVAYYRPEGMAEVSSAELREQTRRLLPDYMVPGRFVRVAQMPLTPNGKVDRKALAALSDEGEETQREGGYEAPQTPTEEIVAGIWAQVLGLAQVGRGENFFELGGHSLLATQVVSRVREALGVEVGLRTLFERPTVCGLSEAVERERGAACGVAASGGVVAVSRGQRLPLSYAQQRLWFLEQLEGGGGLYNIPVAVRLRGGLDVSALEATLTEVVRRHEVLRTSFVMLDGEPTQEISPARRVKAPLTNLTHLPEGEREAEVQRLAREAARQSFDLTRGELMRVRVLLLDADDCCVLLTLHHIVTDGWSMNVLVREIKTLYQAFLESRPSPLPELPLQYADYAVWQHEWLNGGALQSQLDYWKEQLAGIPPSLDLPTSHPRPAVQTFRGAFEPFILSQGLTEKLRALSRQEGVTLFMTLLTGFQSLLSRYSGQDEVVVGTPIAGRTRRETEELIGLFVNTLVLRGDLRGDPTVREMLQRVRQVTLGAYENQDIPFQRLVEELQPPRDLSRSPLFQVMLVLQNTSGPQASMNAGHWAESIEVQTGVAKFDLTLFLSEDGGGLAGALEYNTDLFEPAAVKRMIAHFEQLLGAIASEPERRLSELPLLDDAERRRMLVEWNATATADRPGECVRQMFEAQVERTPDALALTFGEQRLTYRELDSRANQLAHHLRQTGVGPDTLVGILMSPSVEMVVSVFGVLKAGGAYVPFDHMSPDERLAYQVKDAGVKVTLTQPPLSGRLAALPTRAVCPEVERHAIDAQPTSVPPNLTLPAHLAYVIYTSGSTGRPKGVMIHRDGLANYLRWALKTYTGGGGAPLHSSIGFDLTVTSLFLPLLRGETVVLLEQDQTLENLGAALSGNVKFGLLKVTPSHLQFLNQLLPKGRMKCFPEAVVVGGESLAGEELERWQSEAPATRLVNEYGPTETVVGSTFFEVPAGRRFKGPVPIGRPIDNTQIYLLDSAQRPAPVGVTGEIYIGGAGVARGYLNHPGLTAERFVPDPFGPFGGARLYRTGDLARYQPDGILEYLGRSDNQVKLRGYRIELGEIEHVLMAHRAVSEAAVLLDGGRGDERLVGYVALEDGQAVEPQELRRHAKERLPEYMIPTTFIFLESLPRARSGKVDRRALPPPEAESPALAHSYVAPSTPLEHLLSDVWCEALKVKQVGVHDNFFALGGHSLLATKLVSRIREIFNTELLLRELFDNPTVAGLAQIITAAQEKQSQKVKTPQITRRRPKRDKRPALEVGQRPGDEAESTTKV
jgi:amino acid adenylation domain-containing protein